MYQLVSAIAKPIDGHTRWQTVDIGNESFISIFATYSQVYLTLSNPFLDGPVGLDLADIRNATGTLGTTLNDWLTANGNNSLPTGPIRSIDTKWVKYADAFHAGYQVLPVHNTYAPDYPLTDADKPSLLLTRFGADYDLFLKSCLVSVNGFFHLTDGNANGVMVLDGNNSRRVSHHAQCGLHSFREVGEIDLIPIKKEMLYKQGNSPYYLKTYIDIGQDIGNKTLLLVLGGYLHVMDETYYRVGDQHICIDFNNYPLMKRLYESGKFIDLSSLPMEHNDRNPSMMSLADLQSDALIEAYCTLSQSFFVVVDTDDLYVEKIKLEDQDLPGSYVSHVKPELPLFAGFGRTAEYWYQYEDTRWAVNTQLLTVPNYNFQTVDASLERNIDASREPYNPESISSAFFWKIAKDI